MSEHKAGRELDALVAERIFGAKVVPMPMIESHRVEWPDHSHSVGLRPYSTDIAAAWAVVGRMGEEGWDCFIEWKGKGRTYELSAEVSFQRWRKVAPIGQDFGHGVGTAPLAICSAALAAVRGDE